MPQFTPDVKTGLIAGAMSEIGVPGLMRHVETVVVDFSKHRLNMPVGYDILYHSVATGQIPQPGTAHVTDSRCLLSRASVTGIDDVKAQVTLVYERVPPVLWQEDNITVPIKTMNLPHTRTQIMASYSGTGWPTGPLKRACTITYRCPMRKLIIGKAMFGLPLSQLVPDTMKDAVSSVNDRDWMGLPKGYWLFDGLRTRAIDSDDAFQYALCFYVEANFFSQVVHDWSYWQFLQLPNGQFVRVEDSDVEPVVADGYDSEAPSYRGDNDVLTNNKGFAVAYPYPVANFFSIFGIQ